MPVKCQNGCLKKQASWIWNIHWEPVYFEMGNLSKQQTLRMGRGEPGSKAYLYEPSKTKTNTGIQQQGIAKTKNNKTFTH